MRWRSPSRQRGRFAKRVATAGFDGRGSATSCHSRSACKSAEDLSFETADEANTVRVERARDAIDDKW
jgi:hypothetical protein